MWLRFTLISLLKWFAQLTASALIVRYVMPAGWSGYAISAPMWLVNFGLAFGFAEWAYRKTLPGRRETIRLLICWMVVTITLQLLFAQFFLGSVLYFTGSLEMYVQLLLEVLAILLAARVTRKRKMNKVLSEGIEA